MKSKKLRENRSDPMAKYHKAWARRKRLELMFKLGGCCAWCGTSRNLTFDCKHPQGDTHHRYDPSQRMSFYHRQHREGNVQILCKRCNTKKSVSDALIIEMQNAVEVEYSDDPF